MKKKVLKFVGFGCAGCLVAPVLLVIVLRCLLWLAQFLAVGKFVADNPQLFR